MDARRRHPHSFLQGRSELSVLNSQLMVDVAPAAKPGDKSLVEVSSAVLARLLCGRTKGPAIYALDAASAAFVSGPSPNPKARPTLYFNLK